MKFIILTVSILLSFALAVPLTAHADDPNVCIRLAADGVGGPTVILDVFASNKAGSRATVYALNGTALSTQATNPPKELFYLLGGTAYITTKGAIELSLAGTAEDAVCACIQEVAIHVIVDGKDDRYTQVIRNAEDNVTEIITGTAEASSSCGKKK